METYNAAPKGINRVVSDFRRPVDYKLSTKGHAGWIEIMEAGLPARSSVLSTLNAHYEQMKIGKMNSASFSRRESSRETFILVGADTEIRGNRIVLNDHTSFLYVTEHEYFEIHPDELREHGINHCPSTLDVILH